MASRKGNFGILFSGKRKAQYTPVFIYIISIILIGIVLLFGYKAIAAFLSRGEDISYVKFRTDLEGMVAEMGPAYKNIKTGEFALPSKYTEVCFVDSDGASIPSGYPVIKAVVDSGGDENTFLVTDHVEEKFNIGKIEVEEGFLCLQPVAGKLRIQFKGLGDRTGIKEGQYG